MRTRRRKVRGTAVTFQQNKTVQTKVLEPGVNVYGPKGGALKLFYFKGDEGLIEGPAGTGKSRAVLEKFHLCLMKYAGARALIVRKTRSSMTESVLVTYEEKVLPRNSPIKDGPSRATRQSYKYPNGSELIVGGMDRADKVMSTEYDIIGVFEATECTEDDLEKLTTRLRNGVMPYQQLIADCNPAGPQHWLNQRCLANKMERILSRHEDNPSVTKKYLQVLRNLTGVRRARLYEGLWRAQEGLVYEDFGEQHYVDRMPDGWEYWRKFRSVDFGYTNPFVCGWWAVDPDGRLYLYRQIYRTKRLVEDHAKNIVGWSGGELITTTVADHDAEDRATLERHGVPTEPAEKSIIVGIQAVQARLRNAGDGKPRIFFLRDCLLDPDPELQELKKPYETTQEFGEYIWPKPKEEKPEKEIPMDLYNHGMDMVRYAVMYEDSEIINNWPLGHSYSTI